MNGNGKRYRPFLGYSQNGYAAARTYRRTYNGNGIKIPRVTYNRKGPNYYGTVPRTRGVYGSGETKYFDSERTTTVLNQSDNWTDTEFNPTGLNCLFAPTEGAAINERIGREVRVIKIKIRGTITTDPINSATAAPDSSCVRVLLVMDTQTNGTTMQGEQMYSTALSPKDGFQTFQNIDNFGRFRVLKEKMVDIGNPNQSLDIATGNFHINGLCRRFKMTHKFLTTQSVRFNQVGTENVSSIIDNSFHVLANMAGEFLVPLISYNCRVTYKEL